MSEIQAKVVIAALCIGLSTYAENEQVMTIFSQITVRQIYRTPRQTHI